MKIRPFWHIPALFCCYNCCFFWSWLAIAIVAVRIPDKDTRRVTDGRIVLFIPFTIASLVFAFYHEGPNLEFNDLSRHGACWAIVSSWSRLDMVVGIGGSITTYRPFVGQYGTHLVCYHAACGCLCCSGTRGRSLASASGTFMFHSCLFLVPEGQVVCATAVAYPHTIITNAINVCFISFYFFGSQDLSSLLGDRCCDLFMMCAAFVMATHFAAYLVSISGRGGCFGMFVDKLTICSFRLFCRGLAFAKFSFRLLCLRFRAGITYACQGK